jgi:hypothetical protein
MLTVHRKNTSIHVESQQESIRFRGGRAVGKSAGIARQQPRYHMLAQCATRESASGGIFLEVAVCDDYPRQTPQYLRMGR